MRITESKLRRVIRNVIKEIGDSSQSQGPRKLPDSLTTDQRNPMNNMPIENVPQEYFNDAQRGDYSKIPREYHVTLMNYFSEY
tara:strand:+ start:520 stop:768 length:249 start_codon:yes stop_codon:yes gene_type:complete